MSNSYNLGSMFTISMETCVAGHLISEADLHPDRFLPSNQIVVELILGMHGHMWPTDWELPCTGEDVMPY